LKSSIESKDNEIAQLSQDVREFSGKLSSVELERKSFISQSENMQQTTCVLREELENTKKLLQVTEGKLTESEKSKRDLKEKALNTLKT